MLNSTSKFFLKVKYVTEIRNFGLFKSGVRGFYFCYEPLMCNKESKQIFFGSATIAMVCSYGSIIPYWLTACPWQARIPGSRPVTSYVQRLAFTSNPRLMSISLRGGWKWQRGIKIGLPLPYCHVKVNIIETKLIWKKNAVDTTLIIIK